MTAYANPLVSAEIEERGSFIVSIVVGSRMVTGADHCDGRGDAGSSREADGPVHLESDGEGRWPGMNSDTKIRPAHLARPAIVYVRQSSERQVRNNLESQRVQYGLVDRAKHLGWDRVDVVDEDLGLSAAVGTRSGFESALARVAMGEVGAIFCSEVSRLSRNDPDWARLVQVCGLFDTLIGDLDGLYDLSHPDDQMVLGIKGTLSVLEHSLIRRRMQTAQMQKARRGELRKQLPPGFVRDLDDRIVKDPDLRVQEAIQLVFTRFREIWSLRQTMRSFRDEGIELPVLRCRGGRKRLEWALPSLGRIGAILRNPLYAGAYAYGRRQNRLVLKDGRPAKRATCFLPREEWHVLILDHHEAYIPWEVYEDNLAKISGNALKLGGDERVGPVREGQGLLSGLLRCGRCGRRLHVRYQGKSGTNARYLCKGDFDVGGAYCLGFAGLTVDLRFGKVVLDAISPMGLQASLEAEALRDKARQDRRRALELQLESAEYEARRAFEQFDQVDARNRLVAAELERRWNVRLQEVERVQGLLRELDSGIASITEEERGRIRELGSRFDDVWNSPRCPNSLKKKILRTVLEDITVSPEQEGRKLKFVLHWKGGVHTELTMDKPGSPLERKTQQEDLDIIRGMAGFYGDDEIALVLNRLGRKTAKGNRWSTERVATARRRYHVPLREDRAERGVSILNLAQAAQRCGVSPPSLKKVVRLGMLPVNQAAPCAPWEIRVQDLEAEPVISTLAHLKRTGRLPRPQPQKGDGSPVQPSLFPDFSEI